MSFIRTLQPKLVAGALGLLGRCGRRRRCSNVGPGQVAGATYVITPVGKESLAFSDVKPKGFRHNRFSLGDQLFLRTKVKRDGRSPAPRRPRSRSATAVRSWATARMASCQASTTSPTATSTRRARSCSTTRAPAGARS